MATREKLEIIKDSGEIFFFEIEPHREVINFGSHPDNDIVLSGPGISPFHAMLDLRQKPYKFVQLNETAETKGGDQILSPSAALDVHTWDTIELGDYRITLIESEAVEKRQPSERSLIQKESNSPEQALAQPGETSLMPPSSLEGRPPHQIVHAICTGPGGAVGGQGGEVGAPRGATAARDAAEHACAHRQGAGLWPQHRPSTDEAWIPRQHQPIAHQARAHAPAALGHDVGAVLQPPGARARGGAPRGGDRPFSPRRGGGRYRARHELAQCHHWVLVGRTPGGGGDPRTCPPLHLMQQLRVVVQDRRPGMLG